MQCNGTGIKLSKTGERKPCKCGAGGGGMSTGSAPGGYGAPAQQAPVAYGAQASTGYGQQPPGGPGAQPSWQQQANPHASMRMNAPQPTGYGQPPPAQAPGASYSQPPPTHAPSGGSSNDVPLKMWFDAVDTDRSGSIQYKELQRALAMGNLNFSPAVCVQLIRAHNKSGTNTLSFAEFVELHRFLSSAQDSFQYFDKDRSGSLGLGEIYQALKHSGFTLDQTAFYSVCKSFDPDLTGNLRLDAYIALSLFLSSASKTFSAFDPQRTGKVTLDFNQFLYAGSQLV
eukprot:jgi/Mesvir1/27659/Mv07382-RA.1